MLSAIYTSKVSYLSTSNLYDPLFRYTGYRGGGKAVVITSGFLSSYRAQGSGRHVEEVRDGAIKSRKVSFHIREAWEMECFKVKLGPIDSPHSHYG